LNQGNRFFQSRGKKRERETHGDGEKQPPSIPVESGGPSQNLLRNLYQREDEQREGGYNWKGGRGFFSEGCLRGKGDDGMKDLPKLARGKGKHLHNKSRAPNQGSAFLFISRGKESVVYNCKQIAD